MDPDSLSDMHDIGDPTNEPWVAVSRFQIDWQEHTMRCTPLIAVMLLRVSSLAVGEAGGAEQTLLQLEQSLDRYRGAYGPPSGPLVFVGRGDRLAFDRPSPIEETWLLALRQNGSFCRLSPIAAATFALSSRDKATNWKLRVRFEETASGTITGLWWQEGGRAAKFLPRRHPYHEGSVSFEGPAGRLAGRLTLPSEPGPFPAVVFMGGAGPADRNAEYLLVSALFAAKGFATLTYDKRGTGSSQGDWRTSSLSDLAQDVLAAVKFLGARPDIRSDQIGLYGVSEGGAVAAIAASSDSATAFIVSVSAPGIPRGEYEPRWVESELHRAGLSKTDVAEALDFVFLENRFVESRATWTELETASRSAKTKAWFDHTWMGIFRAFAADHWAWGWRRLQNSFDPAVAFGRLRSPVLAIWGEEDTFAPLVSRAAVERALRDGAVPDYKVVPFPRADHVLMENTASPCSMIFAPGFLKTVLEWSSEKARRQ